MISDEFFSIDEHTKRALEVLKRFNKGRKEIWANVGEPKRKKKRVTYLQMELGTYSL